METHEYLLETHEKKPKTHEYLLQTHEGGTYEKQNAANPSFPWNLYKIKERKSVVFDKESFFYSFID
ncbi:hypothetical protein DOZ91_23245 [Peribacillus frigoritolerans]|nr:hypothetical protein DOZ91_23245 [Peribacillus frigoritolerans]